MTRLQIAAKYLGLGRGMARHELAESCQELFSSQNETVFASEHAETVATSSVGPEHSHLDHMETQFLVFARMPRHIQPTRSYAEASSDIT